MIGGMHMTSRFNQRVKIVELLYTADICDTAIETDNTTAFVHQTLMGIEENIEAIDALITNHLERWSLRRLSYVDRAIMRLCVYEMQFTETPAEIAIDEALNLTKLLTDEGDRKAVAFNNSVLDKIRKSIAKE